MNDPDRATRSEDYNFLATIRAANGEIRGVECRLWLPKRMTGKICMVFYPSRRHESFFHRPNPISVRGEVRGFGRDTTTISASEVWVDRIATRSYGKNRQVTVIEANPIDLSVFRRAADHARPLNKLKATIFYVFSHSPSELSSFGIRGHLPSGAVRVKIVRKFAITLRNHRRLIFTNQYHHEDTPEGELTWPDLRAREERVLTRNRLPVLDHDALEDVDDFLTLVTFSSRYANTCIGVESFSELGDHLVFFRKNRSVPPPLRQDTNDSVIDLSDFDEFIRGTYRRFIKSRLNEPDELLRHALQLLTPRVDRTVESEFTTLFAALESLVLWHRRRAGMEFIIEDDATWNALRTDIGAYLKTHPTLHNDKERRKSMREKLGELRRVPFSRAFENLCSTYSVDLHDLWPVLGKQGEMALSEVRNHIVHGSTFQWAQWLGLSDAVFHLRWTTERIVLAILGWPLQKTKVRPEWLARNRTAMIDLERSRAAMRRLPPQGVP